jgi:nucleotide-binding universal stress UspA family protein
MELRTIVVGVDFSPASEVACRQALGLARLRGARVVLAAVAAIPDPPEGLPASMRATADAYLAILRRRVTEEQSELVTLGERLSGQGAEISHVLVDGHPDEALVTAATDLGADLLVVGAHGRRGIGRILGSVAEKVVRTAGCPVLVARGAADAADGGYRRILAATDFSDAADRGLDLALELVAGDGTVELVHFWSLPPLSRAHASDAVAEVLDDLGRGLQAEARRRGTDAVAARDGSRGTVRYQLREGDPRDGILDLAVAAGADLVAVGSHGRRGLGRLLLGSVAQAIVRHAPCSVVVTR